MPPSSQYPAIVWKGYISFGLFSIPVRLYGGARAKTISFHPLHRKDSSRIHEVMYCNQENTQVERPELLEAMRQSQFDGIAKMTMHGREHVVILRPASRGIMLHTMYYIDEIRGVQEFQPHRDLVRDKEVQLAKSLIESLAAEFEPKKYKDGYRENLEKLIEAKLKARKITVPPAPKTARVVDIMAALRKSLIKPARSAGEETDHACGKKTGSIGAAAPYFSSSVSILSWRPN